MATDKKENTPITNEVSDEKLRELRELLENKINALETNEGNQIDFNKQLGKLEKKLETKILVLQQNYDKKPSTVTNEVSSLQLDELEQRLEAKFKAIENGNKNEGTTNQLLIEVE